MSSITEDKSAGLVSSWISPTIFFPNVLAGFIHAVFNVTTAIAVGSLIFSGPLGAHVSMGVGIFMLSTFLGAISIAIFSAYKANIAAPPSGQAPILGAIVAGIVLAMDGASSEAMAVTATAAIGVATLITAGLLFFLGLAKLGAIARYIPFPVMAGFFSGLGLLLCMGAVKLVISSGSTLSFSLITQPDTLLHVLPVIILGLVMFACDLRIRHWLVIPALFALSIALFYLVLFWTGTSVEEAVTKNWLPDVQSVAGGFFPVVTLDQIALISWGSLGGQIGNMMVLAFLTAIMLLLEISGIEMISKQDLDSNKELRIAGFGNAVCGVVGGAPVASESTAAVINVNLGADRFLTNIAYAVAVGAAVILGPSLIAIIPSFVLGGMLFFIGFSLLYVWCWRVRDRLPLTDMAIIAVILLAVAFVGVLQGVAVGIALSTVLFVHQYSQLSTIKTQMNGTEFASNIDRSRQDQDVIDVEAPNMQLLVLQGFLFFGTAFRLLEHIRGTIDHASSDKTVRCLVLDFKHVDGIDSSAKSTFVKLVQVCAAAGISLIFTGCSKSTRQQLGDLDSEAETTSQSIQFHPTLDDGVNWYHETLLLKQDAEATGPESKEETISTGDVERVVGEIFGLPKSEASIAGRWERVTLGKDEVLFQQGDHGDAMYVILSGSIAISLPGREEQLHDVRTLREGAVFGEMALFTGEARSAFATARKSSTVLLRLSRTDFEKLQANHPGMAGRVQQAVITLLSERLARSNRALQALQN